MAQKGLSTAFKTFAPEFGRSKEASRRRPFVVVTSLGKGSGQQMPSGFFELFVVLLEKTNACFFFFNRKRRAAMERPQTKSKSKSSARGSTLAQSLCALRSNLPPPPPPTVTGLYSIPTGRPSSMNDASPDPSIASPGRVDDDDGNGAAPNFAVLLRLFFLGRAARKDDRPTKVGVDVGGGGGTPDRLGARKPKKASLFERIRPSKETNPFSYFPLGSPSRGGVPKHKALHSALLFSPLCFLSFGRSVVLPPPPPDARAGVAKRRRKVCFGAGGMKPRSVTPPPPRIYLLPRPRR